MNQKMIGTMLGLAMLAASFTGCQSGGGNSTEGSTPADPGQDTASQVENPGENGEVLVLEFFQQKGEEGPQKGYQTIIDNFNAANSDVRIEMNTVPDPAKVLTTRVVSNDIPPVFTDFPTQMQFKQKVENGFVMQLSPASFLDRVNPAAIEMGKAPDGETYALPYSNNFYGVYYNKDIFDEHELELPATYAEWIAIMETLQQNGITPLGIASKDPGQVGHMFQGMNVAFLKDGFEKIAQVVEEDASLANDPDYAVFAGKMMEVFSYANDDALGITHNSMWENFANGKYGMALTGSYARGTMLIANPNANLGIFPIPNDTYDSTNILSGIDSAVCVSGMATEAEQAAAMRFLEFLTETDQAQIFCDNDGAPSCITAVAYKDEGVQPVIDMIQKGQVHDWAASTIDANIVNDLYAVTQGFLIDQNIEQYLADMDASIGINKVS